MKKQMKMLSTLCALGICATACGAQDGASDVSGGPLGGNESVSSAEQKIVGLAGNILVWPAGPIAWNGLVGTWPISVWAPSTIGALAFDISGIGGLGVTALGFPGLTAGVITTPFLNAFLGAGTATPWLGVNGSLFGSAGLIAPDFGFAGAFDPFGVGAFGFGAAVPGVGLLSASFANGTLLPGFGSFLTPALTANALMFSNLAAINATTPFTFNVTFTAAQASQAIAFQSASLSIFATPILGSALTTAAIPFTSIAFPIGLPLAASFGAVAGFPGVL
jgi:hypothetical protein